MVLSPEAIGIKNFVE